MKAMKAERKKTAMIIGSFVILAIIVLFIALLLFDINSYRTRIEADASGMTGLDVKINGKVELSFFPFGLSAHDIRFANKEGEILSLEHLKLGTELIPLLKQQLRVTSCELVRPAITIMKDANGKYNFENTAKKSTKGWSVNALSFNVLKVSRGTLVYLDKTTGEKTELKEINLTTKELSIGDTPGDITKNISFAGSMDCKELRKKNLKIDNIKSGIKADKGVFTLKPLTMDIFGAKGEGDVTVNKLEGDTQYRINLNVSKLDFERLQESFAVERLVGGKGDIAVS
jgi:AsmA protein